MIKLSSPTEHPPAVFLSPPNVTIVGKTLQVRQSHWISWQRLVETKLAVRMIEMFSPVVGSLVAEHDGTLAQWLLAADPGLTGPGGGLLNKCLVDHN